MSAASMGSSQTMGLGKSQTRTAGVSGSGGALQHMMLGGNEYAETSG